MLGTPLLSCAPQAARGSLCPARSSEISFSAIRKVLPALRLKIVPATPDSWPAGDECDRSEWPKGTPFPMDSEHDLLSWVPTGQALGRAFQRRQLSVLNDAHLPSTGSQEQA